MTEVSDLRRLKGSCHCGNIQFSYDLPDPGPKIPARACGCGFCRKHGGVHTSHPEGRLGVRIADAAQVARYRFGTKTADFHVCRQCGAVPVVTSEMAGRLYAVVNVNCFDGTSPDDIEQLATDFEGEALEARLARRQRNWIPEVEIGAG